MDMNQTSGLHNHHHHHHQMNGHSHHHHHHCGFQAYFSFTTSSVLLVKEWTTATIMGVVLGALMGTILSIILEALKCYMFVNRLTLVYKQLSTSTRNKPPSVSQRIFSSLLHMLHALTGYILMLLAMSFNAWVMIAIVVGAGLGHFFIRPLFCHFVDLKLRKHLRKDSTAPPKCASKEETEKLRSGNEEAHFGCDDCMEKSLEPDGSTQDDSSSGDNEEEKQAFLSWDPVRQSRQFGVKGKETSV